MNTPISFEIKKLLFNKGWRYKLSLDETGHRVEHSLAEQRWNEGDLSYIDINISEAVMWLYEKHFLWIIALPTVTGHFAYKIVDVQLNPEKPIERPPYNDVSANDYNSPTEAYEDAIIYTLKNLL